MSLPLTRRRFTVEEYYRMAQAGILHEDDRVELIDGEIVQLPPIGDDHAHHVRRLAHLLRGLVGARALVDTLNPLRLDDYTEPLPDLVLLRPRADFYRRHPRPEDVLLVVEVADTTLRYDRAVKVPHYGRAGVPEVWIVDLPHRRVEVYRAPEGGRYHEVHHAAPGTVLVPGALPELRLPVEEVFGGPPGGRESGKTHVR